MTFKWRALSASDGNEMRGWHDAGVYAFYDLDADPDDRDEFRHPPNDILSLAAVDAEERLVGFMSFAPEPGRPGCFSVGLGLRPDRTGGGFGGRFLDEGLSEGRVRLSATHFVVRVADFNQRALTVYRRAGFQIVRRYIQPTNGSGYPFYELERAASGGPEGSRP